MYMYCTSNSWKICFSLACDQIITHSIFCWYTQPVVILRRRPRDIVYRSAGTRRTISRTWPLCCISPSTASTSLLRVPVRTLNEESIRWCFAYQNPSALDEVSFLSSLPSRTVKIGSNVDRNRVGLIVPPVPLSLALLGEAPPTRMKRPSR